MNPSIFDSNHGGYFRTKHNPAHPLLIALLFVAFSCRSSQPEKEISLQEPIPPNHCRIVGTVVSIDPVSQSSDPNDPCARVPCKAAIRVNRVLGYGSAFTKPLSPGNVISVQFAFTTGATKELFPSMASSYPGVQQGTSFQADVRSDEVGGKGGSSPVFVIYGYQIK